MTRDIPASPLGPLGSFLATCRHMTQRDRRNSRRATWWLFGWMISFLGTALAIRFAMLPEGLATYLAIAASGGLGLVAMLAYVRFLREADELQRKIQLEALALGFAGGFLATFTLTLLERSGVQGIDLADPFLVMVLLYMVGLMLGARRYA